MEISSKSPKFLAYGIEIELGRSLIQMASPDIQKDYTAF